MRGKLFAGAFGAAVILVAASMIGGRYEVATALNGSVVRLDRITGEMQACDLEGCWNVERGLPASGR